MYLEKANNTPTWEFRVNRSSLGPWKQQSVSLFQGVLRKRGQGQATPPTLTLIWHPTTFLSLMYWQISPEAMIEKHDDYSSKRKQQSTRKNRTRASAQIPRSGPQKPSQPESAIASSSERDQDARQTPGKSSHTPEVCSPSKERDTGFWQSLSAFKQPQGFTEISGLKGAHSMMTRARMRARPPQSCLTRCDPTDCRPPGSSVHGVLQARVLGWGAISFSIRRSKYGQF